LWSRQQQHPPPPPRSAEEEEEELTSHVCFAWFSARRHSTILPKRKTPNIRSATPKGNPYSAPSRA
jgi:hypothetical protein